jgi:tetratricopeptide (TPR) repeat protein
MDPALTHALAVFAAALLIGLALAFGPFRAYLRANEGPRPMRLWALVAAFGFAGAGIGVYALVGKPTLADAPYAQRLEEFEAVLKRDQLGAPPEVVLEVIAQRARQEPTNPAHPFFAGRYYLLLGESDRAIQSFQRALRLAPDDPEILLAVADVLAESPKGPPPMVVGGLYARALAVLKADDARRPEIEARLRALAQSLPPPTQPAPG